MSLREAAQQALEAIERALPYAPHCGEFDALADMADALRAALAEDALERMSEDERRLGIQMQPVLEPVAWMLTENEKYGNSVVLRKHKPKTYDSDWWTVTPLYTAPPQRKPLTDEEINALELPPSGTATVRDLVRLIERAHGIGGDA